jgi:hypothetical protein
MFAIFGKKKIKEDIVANVFVNTIFNTIDDGFPEIVGIINDAPEFETAPNISQNDVDQFTLIVFAGNLLNASSYFNDHQGDRVVNIVINKLSNVYEIPEEQLSCVIKDYQCYLSKVNHPSKNTLYAMSKAVFGKYNLSDHQDEYFKNMKSPNPMFLKRLDEAMESFVWNWDAFTQKHQINH